MSDVGFQTSDLGLHKKLLAAVLFSNWRVYIYKTYILHVEEYNT
jgi:hypothetical protein